ncbi:MAG: Peptidoglycan glycosyltransferase MrdB [Verrucomicrobia subdivision 3 bacterium]|nr:Peptidoglycan glycosyltransferase MrdB [Limisphaerales bacterium]MCS1413060.1 Peptidoglycan glycosyltransferase MrdB [Limisphaerales bacterium]
MLIVALGLVLMGAAFIYSATSGRLLTDSLAWYQERYVKQLFAAVLGAALAAAICLVDYRLIARWSLVLYWIAIGFLLLVFLFAPVAGVQRWIPLGFINFQPSEFAKLALICLLANFLSRPLNELRLPAVFVKALAMMLLPFGLILIEPDLGSAIVLLPVGFAMMFVSGIPWYYLLRVIGLGVSVVGLTVADVLFAPESLQFVQLEEYQKNRLRVYFGLSFAPSDATSEERRTAERERSKFSYNIEQALISVGSGGWAGKGWQQGTQNTLGYLPRGVAHNDFIFSVIAEEKGFVGSIGVLALYGLLIFSGWRVACNARDRLGKAMAVGVVTLWFSHVFINIGMNIRIMPVTGLPLPLLSDGGSSVLCFLLSIGLLENIYIHRRSY